jgi:hypothetical protein
LIQEYKTVQKSKFLRFSLLLSVGFFSILPIRLTDTGPKPTMEFAFAQEALATPVSIVSGILYECQQSDCSDARPLEELGPQRFTCSTDSCSALAYGFAPYHRIEIEFSDGKTRQSNIFETAGFDSRYQVTVNPEDLLVDALPSTPAPRWTMAVLLLCACALCGGVLLVALTVYLIWRSTKK